MNPQIRVSMTLAATFALAAAATTAGETGVARPAIAGPALPQDLSEQQLRPISLASADFDSDGVADLAAGFAASDGSGVVVLYRGNIDALYPHSPEARQRRADGRFVGEPFLPTERVLSCPHLRTFQAGDFDADGNADLAAGTAGGTELQLLSGNGTGLFGASRVRSSGPLTALGTGDVGARDGLPDLIASVTGAAGSRAVILQSVSGAFSGALTSIALPAAATSIAVEAFAGSSRRRIALLGEDGRVYFLDKERRRAWKRGDAETREELDGARKRSRRAGRRPCLQTQPRRYRFASAQTRPRARSCSLRTLDLDRRAGRGGHVLVDVSTDLADAAPGNGVCGTSTATARYVPPSRKRTRPRPPTSSPSRFQARASRPS